MGIYITITDVRGKAIDEKIERAGWTDVDIEKSIAEAENYIESYLSSQGYTRNKLLKVPLIRTLCINYTRYIVLRDIFTNIAPSISGGEEYTKWRDEVVRILEEIKEKKIHLIDAGGNIVKPSVAKPIITTEKVKRAITMAPSYEWKIDKSYSDEDVVGLK